MGPRRGCLADHDYRYSAAALTRVKPTMLEWFSAAKSFATYANEGGQYDELAKYLGDAATVSKQPVV